jgi:hypothetical protein
MSRSKIFILTVVALIVGAAAVFATSDLVDEHEKKCRENIKVIVHDEPLWRQFRSEAQAAYRKEAAENPPMTGRTYTTPIGEFKTYFGKKRTHFRPSAKNQIVRDDVFIMKGDRTVVQIVDFVYSYGGSLDGPTSFNCLHLYKGMSASHP